MQKNGRPLCLSHSSRFESSAGLASRECQGDDLSTPLACRGIGADSPSCQNHSFLNQNASIISILQRRDTSCKCRTGSPSSAWNRQRTSIANFTAVEGSYQGKVSWGTAGGNYADHISYFVSTQQGTPSVVKNIRMPSASIAKD